MNELSVTTFIDAPPAQVWDVMTMRQEEWWCPKPWRAVFDIVETRPGGRCEMTMYGPDGEVHPHGGIYLAWDEGRRFITTDAITGDFQPSGPFMIGIWESSQKEKAHATPQPPATGPKRTASATQKWALNPAGVPACSN